MFAIPGILGILFFVYLRPQEAYESLQGVPFLYLFFALTLFGAAVDLRLRVTKAIATPALPWAVALVVWCLLTVAITKPETLITNAIGLFITVAIFVLIAQTIQSFRVFEKVAGMVIVLGLCLTFIGIHQSLAPTECLIAPKDRHGTGTPTGRPCLDRARVCYENAEDPGADFICERVGLLGSHSISKRVRYRGILQDPNELAVALSSGLALLIAFSLRTRKRRWMLLSFASLVAVAWGVKATGSRSGQLGFVGVLAVFLFWRYRWKIAVILGPLAVPLLLLVARGGSGRADADASSAERYDAWMTGLHLFRGSPLWGVGYGQFNEHHFLTAHNTYILALAELGAVGVFLFSMIVWISIKTPLTAVRRYAGQREARVAEIWSVGLLAAMAAVLSGSAFLSLTYHQLLWIFMGLSVGLFIAIKRHDPDFTVRISFIDMMVVGLVDALLYVVLFVFLRLKGFY